MGNLAIMTMTNQADEGLLKKHATKNKANFNFDINLQVINFTDDY